MFFALAEQSTCRVHPRVRERSAAERRATTCRDPIPRSLSYHSGLVVGPMAAPRKVALPTHPNGVFTVATTTMSGDALDPRDELTIHIDRYSGAVLAKVGSKDYGLGARAMATGIPLHQGEFGWWNQLFSTLACILIAFLAVSGVVMWWARRPAGAFRLLAPPAPRGFRMPALAGALMVFLGVAFPLGGAAILAVLLLDIFVLRKVEWLCSLVN